MKRRTFGAATAGAALVGARAAIVGSSVGLTNFAEGAGANFRLALLTLGGAQPGGLESLLGELADRGYVKGKTLQFDMRNAVSADEVGRLAAELLLLKPDAVMAVGPQAALALHAQTTTIPIVSISVSYPVQVGIAQSLNHPGGNITGITMVVAGGFSGKLLQLLQEISPRANRIAVLFNSRSPTHTLALSDDVVPSAKRLGIALSLVAAESQADVQKAIDTAVKSKASALMVLADSIFNRPVNFVPDIVASAKLPAIYFFRSSVAAGGLMSYGPVAEAMFKEAAVYVDKIFRGESPANMPFAQPTKFQLVINTTSAAALGLVLPQTLLLQADELIS